MSEDMRPIDCACGARGVEYRTHLPYCPALLKERIAELEKQNAEADNVLRGIHSNCRSITLAQELTKDYFTRKAVSLGSRSC